jgi:hypothetical protein
MDEIIFIERSSAARLASSEMRLNGGIKVIGALFPLYFLFADYKLLV